MFDDNCGKCLICNIPLLGLMWRDANRPAFCRPIYACRVVYSLRVLGRTFWHIFTSVERCFSKRLYDLFGWRLAGDGCMLWAGMTSSYNCTYTNFLVLVIHQRISIVNSRTRGTIDRYS